MKKNLFLISRSGLALMLATVATCFGSFYVLPNQCYSVKSVNNKGKSYAALSLLSKPSWDINQFPTDFKDDLVKLKLKRKTKSAQSATAKSVVKKEVKKLKSPKSKQTKSKGKTRDRKYATSQITQLRKPSNKSSQRANSSPSGAKFSSSPVYA